MMNDWKRAWRSTVRPTKYPGIYERREGGHVVRALVTDATSGRRREIKKVLPEATLAQAVSYLEGRREQCRAGDALPMTSKKRFAVFAVDHYEHKIATRRIVSEAGKMKWKYILLHLIEGTKDDSGRLLVRGFGEFFVDELRVVHIERWKAQVTTKLLDTGAYAPTTCNGWLDILKNILKAAKRDLELPRNPAEDVEPFDVSEHETYTVEEPNSLTPEEVTTFLNALLTMFPQHYAMTVLGLVTGLRPSSLRPLRRCGETPDVRWERAVLEIRRSQTIGDRAMKTTKTKRHQTISLPPALLELLEWHIRTQLTTPEMCASELLFPSVDGGFRAASVLNKPFKIVAEEIGLGKKFTQRGLRRTFQDLARTAQVSDLVTRSISGHATEAMQRHYSTVQAEEQRSA
jgi:integrase